jgi:AraC-like DNA-binding protein
LPEASRKPTNRELTNRFTPMIPSPYSEHPPSADLRAAVACTWVAHVTRDAAAPAPIVPDACSDVVVIGDAAPHVAGPATRTHSVHVPASTTVVGIRFRPGAARAVFGCDAHELRDAAPELRAVCGVSASVLAAELSAATTTDAMRAALERWARCRLAPRLERDVMALRAAHALVTDHRQSVTALGEMFGWSPRRLHREMTETCGYGAKTLQRILRLQRTLRMARQRALAHRRPTLARLALDADYADQAHMTRDFRDLTGFTPRELLAHSHADVGAWLDASGVDRTRE